MSEPRLLQHVHLGDVAMPGAHPGEIPHLAPHLLDRRLDHPRGPHLVGRPRLPAHAAFRLLRLLPLDLGTERFPIGGKNILGNFRNIFPFIARRLVESGFPFGKGRIAMGHRHEPQGGNIVFHRKGGLLEIIGEGVTRIIKGEQALADMGAFLRMKRAHAAHHVGIQPAFDL